jgi:hypothetical protein
VARARNIKPSFFTNEILADLPALTRLAFVGLWCLADRDGRLEDRPKRIKGQLFPYDDIDIDAALDALADAGFIVRYAVEDRAFVSILQFARHQSPHVKEAKSTIPAPESEGARIVRPVRVPVVAPGKPDASTGQAPGRHGADTGRAALIPDSGFLIPETPTADESAEREGDETEGKGEDYPEEFVDFWHAYPARTGDNPKRRAYRAWHARRGEGHSAAEILDGTLRYRAHLKALGKIGTEFVKQAATFLGPDKAFLLSWEVPKPAPDKHRASTGPAWWASDEGIVAKGRELGLEARVGESFRDFAARIRERIEATA